MPASLEARQPFGRSHARRNLPQLRRQKPDRRPRQQPPTRLRPLLVLNSLSPPAAPPSLPTPTSPPRLPPPAKPPSSWTAGPLVRPCRAVAPILDQLAAESAGRYRIAKLNTDENPRTASQFRIDSIPTLLIFRHGKLIDRLVGAHPKPTIASPPLRRRLRLTLPKLHPRKMIHKYHETLK